MQAQNTITESLVKLLSKLAVEQGLIKQKRGDINFSEISRKTGIPQGTISRIFRGKIPDPGVENMAKLMQTLQFPIENILLDPKTLQIVLALKYLDDHDKDLILNFIKAKEEISE